MVMMSESATTETIPSAEALHSPGGDQELLRPSQSTTGERGGGEEPQADQEQPAAAIKVAAGAASNRKPPKVSR